jgi:DME family drug/metabolite transporter
MIGELAAIGAAISWAIAPIMYRSALSNTNPVSANIVRCATNAAVLMILLFALGMGGVLASLPLWVVLVTVFSGLIGLGLGDTLYMSGLKTIGVSRAVPLASSYPLFGLIWAVLLLGQPLSLFAVVGAVVILLGIWLLSQRNNVEVTQAKGKMLLLGVIFSLVTAIVWSISLTLMDIVVSNGITGLQANYAITTIRITSIALFLGAASPLIDRSQGFMKISRRAITLLCLGGLIANGVGWLLMNYSFLNLPEAQAIPISSTSPLFASFAGYLLFREKATLWSVSGAIAIIVGIVLIFAV